MVDAGGELDRHVKLPTQLADEADPGGAHLGSWPDRSAWRSRTGKASGERSVLVRLCSSARDSGSHDAEDDLGGGHVRDRGREPEAVAVSADPGQVLLAGRRRR